MSYKELLDFLIEQRACSEAQEWILANKYGLQEAWANCTRGNWMIWLARKMEMEGDYKEIFNYIYDCMVERWDKEHTFIEKLDSYLRRFSIDFATEAAADEGYRIFGLDTSEIVRDVFELKT